MVQDKRIMIALLALSAVLLATSCHPSKRNDKFSLYDLQGRRTIVDAQAIDALKGRRLLLVGEHHTVAAHHKAQLQIIQMLNEESIFLSIGLEMFPTGQQAALDRWVGGDIDEAAFEKIYLENWNFPWSLYRDIFVYARDKNIPLVGLNVSRGITKQVAKQGFASLSEQQRGEMEGITCNVTREYRDFVRHAFGAHGHDSMDFVRFCEAQLVWDTAMAINAMNHLYRHDDRIMVLLAGSGHARKMGVPQQVKTRSSIPFTVLMPHSPGIFEPDTLTSADADFIIMPPF